MCLPPLAADRHVTFIPGLLLRAEVPGDYGKV